MTTNSQKSTIIIYDSAVQSAALKSLHGNARFKNISTSTPGKKKR